MSRLIGTVEELERRCKRAVQAVAEGQPRATVARWVSAARRPAGLDAEPQPGPTPGLSDGELRKLEALLVLGAKAHGWRNELWTAARVARLIGRYFRIDYHPEYVRKILRDRLGWTGQKPRRKAGNATTRRWAGG